MRQVHEVNASSSRSGKQILSQLQEATQSHQVSSKSIHSPSKRAGNDANKAEKPDVKMSAAFTNLFKKSSTQNPPVDSDKGKKRKRSKQEKDDTMGKRQKKEGLKGGGKAPGLVEGKSADVASTNINLSSTTLILFDEVDVVFEEDKGFLNAVQTFMSTTKIPIILTTAVPSFNTQFDGRYELLTLKTPPVASVTSHLQTISLAENLRVDREHLSELVLQCRGDVRKSLMSVQYQLESGGGYTVSYRTIAKPSTVGLEEKTGRSLSLEDSQHSLTNVGSSSIDRKPSDECNTAKEEEDDDDFVILKPLKKRRRMLDDNSNSVDSFVDTFKTKLEPVVDSVADDGAASAFPPVHSLCIETMLGINAAHNSVSAALTHALKAKSCEGLSELISLCYSIKELLSTSLVYNNLPLVLPLTSVLVHSVAKPDMDTRTHKKDKKRKRIQCDLYDSEASNDGSESVEQHSDQGIDSDSVDNSAKSSNCNKSDCPQEGKCLYESLSAFSKFCDNMCVMDTLESSQSLRHDSMLGPGIKGRLVPGVADELPAFPVPCGIDMECCRVYGSEVEGRSAVQLYREMDEIQGRVETLCENNPALSQHFQLPVLRSSERMSLLDRHTATVPADLLRIHASTVDSLPLVVHKHPRNLHLDYLPTLRNICRQESCRQLTNAKRRFHHYFDNIALPLKEKTMAVLATSCL